MVSVALQMTDDQIYLKHNSIMHGKPPIHKKYEFFFSKLSLKLKDKLTNYIHSELFRTYFAFFPPLIKSSACLLKEGLGWGWAWLKW
jgi:hypothetical protein